MAPESILIGCSLLGIVGAVWMAAALHGARELLRLQMDEVLRIKEELKDTLVKISAVHNTLTTAQQDINLKLSAFEAKLRGFK